MKGNPVEHARRPDYTVDQYSEQSYDFTNVYGEIKSGSNVELEDLCRIIYFSSQAHRTYNLKVLVGQKKKNLITIHGLM